MLLHYLLCNPGIGTPDQEVNSALYQSLLSGDGTLPIDAPSKDRLLVAFGRLNADGKMEAIRRTEKLARIPTYQALPTDFSPDKIEALQFACHRFLNAKYELELMAEQGTTSGAGVDSANRLIARATEQIINIVLFHKQLCIFLCAA